MMYILGFLVLLLILFFSFKGKIKDMVEKKIKNKQSKKEDNDEFVFLPIGLARTFSITFTMEEVGNGQAKITINKKNITE